MSARYALYFAPAPGSAWHRFGETALRGAARRYGFHATLKAPFRLQRTLESLRAELDRFCAARAAFAAPAMQVRQLDDFLAVVPAQPDPRLDRLAADCVRHFDGWRAPLTEAEISRRRLRALSPRQIEYLERWGYPYVLEEFRFHFSLTGPGEKAPAPSLPEEPLGVDALSIFEEPAPGADFRPIHRSPLRGGRLVYIVGPSGAGKDSLIEWLRARRPAGVIIAERRETRSTSDTEFDALEERSAFALQWQANGHRYGIGREIEGWLAKGLTVVVNGSRAHAARAMADFPQTEIVHVSAPLAVLRKRLGERGREAPAEVERRLERRIAVPRAALEIVNDGPLERAGQRLLEFATSAAQPPARDPHRQPAPA